jgi:hypothetical protein
VLLDLADFATSKVDYASVYLVASLSASTLAASAWSLTALLAVSNLPLAVVTAGVSLSASVLAAST